MKRTHLTQMLARLLPPLLAASLLSACAGTRPLKPGKATLHSVAPATGAQFTSELKQPENPAQSAAQSFERTTETELPLPRGTTVQENTATRDEHAREAPRILSTRTIVLPEPVIQKTRTVEKAGTSIGAAQKDTAHELGARLSSLKGVVWVGIGLFVFGLATLAYPPLRAVIGSVTTSVAIMAGGLALIILPTMLVGHELMLLSGVALAVGGWFIAHRHGELRARARPR
jgi:hypothetical protein